MIEEITIQFRRDLFYEKCLQRNQISYINAMFQQSIRGILFSESTTRAIMPRIKNLTCKNGFDSVLELMSLLQDLSTSRNCRILSDPSINKQPKPYNNRRIEKIMKYVNRHFSQNINLSDAARIARMTEVPLSRFFSF